MGGAPYKIPGTSGGGHPSVADFDNDGMLEIGVAGLNIFVVIENDLTLKWSRQVKDASQMTTASVFDFDNDGSSDVVYVEEKYLRVWDGKTGNIKAQEECGNGTRTNFPTVVDANGDGQANIACICADKSPIPLSQFRKGYLKVFSSGTVPWVASRKIMNQHNYYNVNIEEDMSICAQQQDHSKISELNMYLSQSPLYDGNGNTLPLAAPDIITTIDSFKFLCGDSIELYFTTCNQGIFSMPAGFPVSFYNGDPHIGGTLIGDIKINVSIDTINCHSQMTKLYVPTSIDLYTYVNDSGIAPINAPKIMIPECDTTNNWDHILISVGSTQITEQLTDVSCYGGNDGNIKIFVNNLSGPLHFSINGGVTQSSSVFNNLIAGNYVIDIINNCQDTISRNVTISEPTEISIEIDSLNIDCQGNNTGEAYGYVLGGNVPYSYNWSAGIVSASGDTIKGLTAGMYYLTIEDQNNCIRIDSIKVNEPLNPLTSILDTIHISCNSGNDGKAWIVATGGSPTYSYLWSGGITANSDTISNLTVGNYSVTVTDLNFCTNTHVFTIHEPLPLGLNYTKQDVICDQISGNINVSISGGVSPYSYQWSNGMNSAVINNLSSGQYALVVTDQQACQYIQLFAVDSVPPAPIDFVYTDSCEGLNIAFDGISDPGAIAQWAWDMGDGSTYLTEDVQHVYQISSIYQVQLMITDTNNCSSQLTEPFQLYPNPLIDFKVLDSTACDELYVSFDDLTIAEQGSEYLWTFEGHGISLDKEPLISFSGAGSYDVKLEVVSPYGCKAEYEKTDYIKIYESPVASFIYYPDEDLSITGPPIEFIDQSMGSVLWYWTFGDGAISNVQNPENQYKNAGEFTVMQKVFSVDGCSDSIYSIITIYPIFEVFIPNAFSPNGDGKNDKLYVRALNAESMEFFIYNRWGEQVFSTTNLNEGWDGTFNGEELNSEVYIYVGIVKFLNEEKQTIKGNVTLVR